MNSYTVVIVGRPNVGKSALFNRLCGKPSAIVDDRPGVTRDRLYERVYWKDKVFQIIDTGGLFFNQKKESLSADFQIEIELQVDIAIQQASVVLFVVDNNSGITPLDLEIAHKLRSFKKEVLIVANKVDHPDHESHMTEFYNLSLGEVIPISSKHGLNIGTLLDRIIELLPKTINHNDLADPSIHISILGRPNVGKSSLFNALIGEERSIISDIAGTTHDAIDTDLFVNNQLYRFIDTAGIRKRKKVDTRIEQLCIQQATRAIERSDICILLIDPREGVTKQEQTIANLIAEKQKGCLIILNKTDLIDDEHINAFEDHIFDRLKFIDYAPLLMLSAKQKINIDAVLPLIQTIYHEYTKKIPTPELNKFLQNATQKAPPKSVSGKTAKFFYGAQVHNAPPRFSFFVNDPKLVQTNYKRYLENQLREHFAFAGSPVSFTFRRRSRKKGGVLYG